MEKMIVRIESLEHFFARSKELALKMGQGIPLEESCIRGFEDPEDLHALFTPERLAILTTLLERPCTLRQLQFRLGRDVGELEQDVHQLLLAGIIESPHAGPNNNIDTEFQPVARTIVFESPPAGATEKALEFLAAGGMPA